MVRTMQTTAPSSSGKKKRIDAAADGGATDSGAAATTAAKRKASAKTHRRASLSQCKSASLRLFRRVAEQENTRRGDGDASKNPHPMRLSQRAHDHMSFLIRNMEQQLFTQCRKLMRTRTMSPKLLTVSMFMGYYKDLAKSAAKRAHALCTRMNQLDREYEAGVKQLASGVRADGTRIGFRIVASKS